MPIVLHKPQTSRPIDVLERVLINDTTKSSRGIHDEVFGPGEKSDHEHRQWAHFNSLHPQVAHYCEKLLGEPVLADLRHAS